jgi:5,10-methylene-tetrahydrofolate dehydrogenase/methenyl tetrahydrofolate cyclohydrolase
MADNSALPLPKGVEAELVLERLRSNKVLEVLHQEALRRVKDNVCMITILPCNLPLPLKLCLSSLSIVFR